MDWSRIVMIAHGWFRELAQAGGYKFKNIKSKASKC